MLGDLLRRSQRPLLAGILASWLLTLSAMSHCAGKPDPEDAAEPSVAEQLDTLEARMYRIRQVEDELGGVEGSVLDALLFRQDEASLDVLRRFNVIARRILALPEGASERGELAARLALRNEQLDTGFQLRFGNLEDRIAQKNLELDALSGADRAFLAGQLEGLNEQRLRYLEAMTDVVRVREQLQFPSGALERLANDSLLRYADERTGALQLYKAQRSALQTQLKLSPGDEDASAALKRTERLLSATVARLRRAVAQMERVGLDATTLKRLLFEEQTTVTLDVVDADVVAVIFEDLQLSIVRWFTEKGPTAGVQLLLFLGILFITRLLSRVARRLTQRTLDSRPGGMSQLLRDVIVSLVGGIILGIGVLIALAQLGISLAPMLAGLGVAGFILGFALQDTLANFAAGGMILAYRPFDVDDYVSVAGIEGTVKRMNLVSTKITTVDNQTLIVPNSKIWGDVIRNYTGQQVRRVDTEFSISYDDSIEQAEQVLWSVLEQIPAILKSPEPNIRVHRHAESSIDFIVRPWVRTEDYWPTFWTLQREVKLAFDEAGISIPFPQRDVHHYYPSGASDEGRPA